MANPYYQGPVSDHYDGERFYNYGPPSDRPPYAFLRWQLTAKPRAWPVDLPDSKEDTPPPRVEGNGLRVSLVGHATVLIQAQGLNIVTDPVWSKRASPLSFMGPRRIAPPGIPFDKLPKIDIAIVSHSHYDHMDVATLKKLHARDNPLVLTPLGNDTLMKKHIPQLNTVAMDWGQAASSGAVKFHAEPAQHWSSRTLRDRDRALWASYVIETPAGNIYFAGDTGYGAHFRKALEKFGKFRFALLPIGAYEPRWFMKHHHMNPADAVMAYEDLGAPPTMALHFGTFRLSDEGYGEPVSDLKGALAEKGIPEERFRALPDGSFWQVD